MKVIDELDDLDIMFLEHYGVKGMKWGVRRTQEQLDRAAGRRSSSSSGSGSSSSKKPKARLRSYTPKSKKTSSSSSNKPKLRSYTKNNSNKPKLGSYTKNNSSKARLGSRNVDSLNDQELREITNRMEMEKKYSSLSTPRKNRGRRAVDSYLSTLKTFNDVVNTTTQTYKNGKKIYDFARRR